MISIDTDTLALILGNFFTRSELCDQKVEFVCHQWAYTVQHFVRNVHLSQQIDLKIAPNNTVLITNMHVSALADGGAIQFERSSPNDFVLELPFGATDLRTNFANWPHTVGFSTASGIGTAPCSNWDIEVPSNRSNCPTSLPAELTKLGTAVSGFWPPSFVAFNSLHICPGAIRHDTIRFLAHFSRQLRGLKMIGIQFEEHWDNNFSALLDWLWMQLPRTPPIDLIQCQVDLRKNDRVMGPPDCWYPMDEITRWLSSPLQKISSGPMHGYGPVKELHLWDNSEKYYAEAGDTCAAYYSTAKPTYTCPPMVLFSHIIEMFKNGPHDGARWTTPFTIFGYCDRGDCARHVESWANHETRREDGKILKFTKSENGVKSMLEFLPALKFPDKAFID